MDCKEFIDTAETGFGPLSERQKEQFGLLDGLYRDWNSKINVISRKDMDGLYLHHVLHSLAIAGYMKSRLPEDYARSAGNHGQATDLSAGQVSDGTAAQADSPFSGGTAGQTDGAFSDGRAGQADGQDSAGRTSAPLRYLDLGTGGGFPGIPLAILFPGAQFTLCDSVGKKIMVAEAVSKALGLENVRTVNARAEDLDADFDYVVSRAVTSLDRFIPWVRKKYGKGILYLKGGDVVEEIAVMMGKYRMKPGSVRTWRISGWNNDPYFDGKLLIHIGKI